MLVRFFYVLISNQISSGFDSHGSAAGVSSVPRLRCRQATPYSSRYTTVKDSSSTARPHAVATDGENSVPTSTARKSRAKISRDVGGVFQSLYHSVISGCSIIVFVFTSVTHSFQIKPTARHSRSFRYGAGPFTSSQCCKVLRGMQYLSQNCICVSPVAARISLIVMCAASQTAATSDALSSGNCPDCVQRVMKDVRWSLLCKASFQIALNNLSFILLRPQLKLWLLQTHEPGCYLS